MTETEAIVKRISCRAYQDTPLSEELRQALQAKIDELNAASGLRFQLITTEDGNRPDIKLPPTMFTGRITTYAALVGRDDELAEEMAGYYGEQLVLFATALGIGTCWVGGTYEPDSMTAYVPEGEKAWDVIPMGYAIEPVPERQRAIREKIRSRDRALNDFIEGDTPFDALPDWIKKGIEYIRLGPSAVNLQPVNIVYSEGRVYAKLRSRGGMNFNDLGIAKYQFEAAARECGINGKWAFGDPAEFVISLS